MAVDIQIVPLCDSLNVYGPPDKSATYSLSGRVEITISSSHSFYEKPRLEKLLLESLEVVFEGQSELAIDGSGYSAVRLCQITRQLVRGPPKELSNKTAAPHFNACKWEAIFDIPVPGWLPATSFFGNTGDNEPAGIQYALHATARVRSIDEESVKTGWSSLLCGLWTTKGKALQAPKMPIVLNRVFQPNSPNYTPSSAAASSFASTSCVVQTTVQRPTNPSPPAHMRIPADVLSALNVLVEFPQHIPIHSDSFPFTLRARLDPKLPMHKRKRVKMIGFNVDIVQFERYRSTPSSAFSRSYPLPPKSEQPPHKPLLSPHPFENLVSTGIYGAPLAEGSYSETVTSIVTQDPAQRSYRTANSGMRLDGEGCVRFDITLPMNGELLRRTEADVPAAYRKLKSNSSEARTIRTTFESPMLKTHHELRVELACSYQYDTNCHKPTVAEEILRFAVPLHFVVTPSYESKNPVRASRDSTRTTPTSYLRSDDMQIPAYCQLFYPNGDPREVAWGREPLPVYRRYDQPREVGEEASPLLRGIVA